MTPELIESLLVGLAALWTAMFTGFLALWKWQSSRDTERAREREHELKMINKSIEEKKAQVEADAQDRISALKDEILSIRQTVENRLFQALDDQHETNRCLEETVAGYSNEVTRVGESQLAAITSLESNIITRISTEYREILKMVGNLIDHTAKIETGVEDLVKQVAAHHENVMKAIQSIGDPENVAN